MAYFNNCAAKVLTAAITVTTIRDDRISNGGAGLYEAACQVARLLRETFDEARQTSSERARPLNQHGAARANGYAHTASAFPQSSSQSLAADVSEVSHPSIRALSWRSGRRRIIRVRMEERRSL